MKSLNILKFSVVLISLLINLSSAQNGANFGGLDVSQSCLSTIQSLLGDQQLTACFPFLSFAQYLYPSAGAGSNSTDDIYTSQVNSLCAMPKCSAQVVNNTLTKVINGCASDLANQNTIANSMKGFISIYSPYRDALCLKNSTTGNYCVIETKNAIMNYTATANPVMNYKNYQNASDVINNIPSEMLCTNCNKGFMTIFLNFEKNNTDLFNNQYLAPLTREEPAIKDALANKCGESFLEGSMSMLNTSPNGTVSVPESLNSNSTSAAAPFGGVRSSYLVGIVSLVVSLSLF
ncbi:4718_t:CDS:1 [Ambispora leptoticha]|uniref:4718_t:CDS:1 n=1 Tax=Ambispora leptoticha TaxID=144679 RepID=A0A9N8ZQX9_9GLOM|nr:4718_t:CDS:1 [Ambispora leptoticha]